MKHLLKKILTPIIERRLVLSLLSFAAGLPSLPALAQEAAQVIAPAQTEQLPAGFTEKSATVNGVRISGLLGISSGNGNLRTLVRPGDRQIKTSKLAESRKWRAARR
jgi:hypothetical protein